CRFGARPPPPRTGPARPRSSETCRKPTATRGRSKFGSGSTRRTRASSPTCPPKSPSKTPARLAAPRPKKLLPTTDPEQEKLMSTDTAMARLVGLSKCFVKGKEAIPVFDRLDLAIPQGDFIAVMGPSGSGKTTLLNLLGGIDYPDSGELYVGGTRLDLLGEGRLTRWRGTNIGFIFQFYNLMPMLTAGQNVELPLLLTKLRARERRRRAETALKVV